MYRIYYQNNIICSVKQKINHLFHVYNYLLIDTFLSDTNVGIFKKKILKIFEMKIS